MKRAIETSAAPRPMGPYSQAMRVGDLVFTAGQAPVDPLPGTLVGDTIEEHGSQLLGILVEIDLIPEMPPAGSPT